MSVVLMSVAVTSRQNDVQPLQLVHLVMLAHTFLHWANVLLIISKCLGLSCCLSPISSFLLRYILGDSG